MIVTYNSEKEIAGCLESIEKHTDSYEVFVVDNNSKDKTKEAVYGAKIEKKELISFQGLTENIGYASAVNHGIQHTSGEYIIMLNPDTRVHPLWADRMAAHFNNKPNVGAVGPVSTNCLSTQSYYSIYGAHTKEEDMCEQVLRNATSYDTTKLLIGFCLMTRRGIMNKIGKLDPNCFLGNDDLEYGLRLRMHGYELIVAKDAFIAHDMQKSFASVPKETTSKLVQESTDYLYKKLFKVFDGKVPSPEELWGINWFKPSQELIDDLSRANI